MKKRGFNISLGNTLGRLTFSKSIDFTSEQSWSSNTRETEIFSDEILSFQRHLEKQFKIYFSAHIADFQVISSEKRILIAS